MTDSKLFTESTVGKFANFFVSPFVELSIERYYKNWFVEAYIDPSEPKFYVVFKNDVIPTIFKTKTYCNDFDIDDEHIVVIYNVRPELHDDYFNFINGKYSLLSETFKTKLQDFRTDLKRNVTFKVGNEIRTTNAVVYSVIEKHPHYIKIMEEELGCKIPHYSELAQAPGIQNFKSFEEFFIEETSNERTDN